MDPKGNHPTDAEAHAFANQVCRGNPEALIFCGLWYKYCHQIDDVLDTREDGRPTMTSEEILEVFAIAALLYNCAYFQRHRMLLFPIALSVTNLYATSVKWEKSPEKHRRIMGDVLRTVGDHMLFMIAFIEGGWANMRAVTDPIMDKDWLLQHDEHGNPL